MLEKLQIAFDAYDNFFRSHQPDIYTSQDSQYFHNRTKKRDYVFGESKIDTEDTDQIGKIYSLQPAVFDKLSDIISKSSHVQALPFVMGTYNPTNLSMTMNDICFSDFLEAGLAVSGHNIGYSEAILRGIYFLGRRSWWRHESIHVRHHLQMSHFLDYRDRANLDPDSIYWKTVNNLEKAGYTIHESGVEEILTRYQTLKEARGVKEKLVASLALLLYFEYSPFTGPRNLMIDTKEKTLDLVKNGALRIPLKIATIGALGYLPLHLDNQYGVSNFLAEQIAGMIPVSASVIETIIGRGEAYYAVSLMGAMFSTKEKGAFETLHESSDYSSTKKYKFPYTYNPALALLRTIHFVSFIDHLWDHIPHFRQVRSANDVYELKDEVAASIQGNIGKKEQEIILQIMDDVLQHYKTARPSTFPHDIYPKGLFIPAMYLRLPQLYRSEV